MPVFGVVAVAVGSLGIGILVAALGLALGNMGGIIVWNGLEVLQFGKARAQGLGAVWLWVRSQWQWRVCEVWFAGGCECAIGQFGNFNF